MKKLFIALCLLLSALLCLCSCGETDAGGKGNSGNSGGEGVGVREIANLSEYTIVRGDNAGKEIKDLVTILRNAIIEKTGAELDPGTDYGGEKKYEILIGETKRSASTEVKSTFKSDFDYTVKLDGNKIVILGSTDEMTAEAVNTFVESFIQNGKVYAPTGNGYSVKKDFPVKSLSVAGGDISEFSVYYVTEKEIGTAKTSLQYANELCSAFADKIGKKVNTITDISTGKKYITVDASSLDYTKGSIEITENSIILKGSYHSMPTVMDTFFNTLIGDSESVELKAGVTEIDTADIPSIYSKEDLMKVLEYAYNDNDVLIVGDQAGGSREMPSTFFEKYNEGNLEKGGYFTGTGRDPAITGLDLGRCGMLLAFIKDNEWPAISQMVCELVDYAAKGGIVTLGAHFRNPNFADNADLPQWQSDRGELGGAAEWNDLITPGTEINSNFMIELERIGMVLKALDDAGVPVIWRPLHEMDGGWFWWTPSGDAGANHYVAFWKYIYKYLTEDLGLDNLLWHYSPSITDKCLAYYPGDEYVDMVGCDWYTRGNMELLDDHMPYEMLMSKGKVTNLAEIGIGDELMSDNIRDQETLFNAENYEKILKELYDEGYKIAMFVTYTHKHTLAYLPGGDEFMQSEAVIDLSEMPALFEKVTGFKVGN